MVKLMTPTKTRTFVALIVLQTYIFDYLNGNHLDFIGIMATIFSNRNQVIHLIMLFNLVQCAHHSLRY